MLSSRSAWATQQSEWWGREGREEKGHGGKQGEGINMNTEGNRERG